MPHFDPVITDCSHCSANKPNLVSFVRNESKITSFLFLDDPETTETVGWFVNAAFNGGISVCFHNIARRPCHISLHQHIRFKYKRGG